MTKTDAELMLGLKAGNASCLRDLMARYRLPVIHHLRRFVKNYAVAEELSQEVFWRVYRARGGYEPTAKFTTWLYRIATHVALNWLRDTRHEKGVESLQRVSSHGQQRQLVDRCPTVDQMIVRRVRCREVQSAIDTLPERQRTAVVLHKYEDLEYRQIAEFLCCSVPTVKSLIFRAHSTLRLRLAHMA